VSGGPGSGLYSSRDGGDTWKELGKDEGMPEGIKGKIGCAIAPSDGLRVYALIESEKGGLYRSDDGGEHFSLANAHRSLRQRVWYYSTLAVDPKNADIVWFPEVPLLRTIDGGKTIQSVRAHHGDLHGCRCAEVHDATDDVTGFERELGIGELVPEHPAQLLFEGIEAKRRLRPERHLQDAVVRGLFSSGSGSGRIDLEPGSSRLGLTVI
jgi:photosystem II stability/assembly factor-like uncharacterized protein